MKTSAAVLGVIGAAGPFAESRPVNIEELELDPPATGELLVRIESAGVCHSDLSVVDGSRPRPVPLALGHEAAGIVESVGPGVVDVTPGDHVVLTFVPSCGVCANCSAGRPTLCAPALAANTSGALLGGGRRLHRESGGDVHHHLGVSAFSQFAVVARGSAVVVPEDVPFDIAALLGCAVLTGVCAVLETARVRPGESVAVFGLGGVGLAAVIGAVLSGAAPILGVDPVSEKRDLALALGATAALSPDEAKAGLRDMMGGGTRYAFETAGALPALEAAYAATARGGTTIAVGLPHPSRTIAVPAAALVGESRTLTGSYIGSSVPQRDIP
ncbi:MAG: alcohol dehydrogenase catalytic domain-containing protein, partial [Gaiellaceae bacterium]